MSGRGGNRQLEECSAGAGDLVQDCERGQAMVEFTLIFPVLFLTVLSIMQMGILYGKQLDLKGAVREGARTASIKYDAPEPAVEAENAVFAAATLIPDEDITVTVTPTPNPVWNHGDVITVTASSPWSFNIMGAVIFDGTLTKESTIRVE